MVTHGALLIDVSMSQSLSLIHAHKYISIEAKAFEVSFHLFKWKKKMKRKNRMKFGRWTSCFFFHFFSCLRLNKYLSYCVSSGQKKRPIGFFFYLFVEYFKNKLSLSAIDLFTVCYDTFQDKKKKKIPDNSLDNNGLKTAPREIWLAFSFGCITFVISFRKSFKPCELVTFIRRSEWN